MSGSLVEGLGRLTKAAGLLFLAALVLAAPVVATLQWGLAGLLTFIAIAAAWHGGMLWESIRRKPADDSFTKHVAPTIKGDDWWRRR